MPEHSGIWSRAIFDVYCVSEAGEHLGVEMRKGEQNFFKDRRVYYFTFPVREQSSLRAMGL